MIDDLKEIKKIYGENFSHLCRDNFSIILNEPGVLLQILESNFASTKSLYETIISSNKLIYDFKNYIFDEYYKIRNQKSKEKIEITETPYELLDKAGYELFECQSESDIQSFKKWYKYGEVICTIYNGGRLNRCYVFFAVKKNANDIKREDFNNPKREDLYSTSVLSIQFPKQGTCIPDIISRYNHTVRDPNATYGCDLNKIAPNLEESFKKLLESRGIELNAANKEDLYLPGFTKASDGKYYKYNIEVNGVFYCENNIIINGGNIIKLEPEKYLIIDYFIVDLVHKEIKLYDEFLHDSFLKGLGDIKNIKIEKNNEGKNIIISKDNTEDIIITIDKENQIIYYKNTNLDRIGDCFLQHNNKLKRIDIPNVEEIGINFLNDNLLLEELELPKVTRVGYHFLSGNILLNKINLPKVNTIGERFLTHNNCLESLNLPEAIDIGEAFLYFNKKLKEIYLPKVRVIRDNFLYYNKSLKKLDLPKVESIKDYFLYFNEQLESLNIKNVKYIGNSFLMENKSLKWLELPNVKTIGGAFMYQNKSLKTINMSIDPNNFKYIKNLHIRNLLIQQEKERLIELKEQIENNKKTI